MITDKDRMDWLCARVTYVEHKDKNGVLCSRAPVGGYWPQGEHKEDNADPDMIGLDLEDYIDAQIKKEKSQ